MYFFFVVHPEMINIFIDILAKVQPDSSGITPTGLRKFLFAVFVVSFVYSLITIYLLVILFYYWRYKQTYKTKTIWTDATQIELVALRKVFLQVHLQRITYLHLLLSQEFLSDKVTKSKEEKIEKFPITSSILNSEKLSMHMRVYEENYLRKIGNIQYDKKFLFIITLTFGRRFRQDTGLHGILE